MAEKKTHFGRAGEFAALSEFLFRGYNTAIPSVDVGDDAFVINDRDGTTWRVQVKTSEVVETKGKRESFYNLSRSQLVLVKPSDLFFMLMARWDDRWHYVLIPRAKLQAIRLEFEKPTGKKKRGRPPVASEAAMSDQVSLKVTWKEAAPMGWNASLEDYFDRWPKELPPITDGPGSTTQAASR